MGVYIALILNVNCCVSFLTALSYHVIACCIHECCFCLVYYSFLLIADICMTSTSMLSIIYIQQQLQLFMLNMYIVQSASTLNRCSAEYIKFPISTSISRLNTSERGET